MIVCHILMRSNCPHQPPGEMECEGFEGDCLRRGRSRNRRGHSLSLRNPGDPPKRRGRPPKKDGLTVKERQRLARAERAKTVLTRVRRHRSHLFDEEDSLEEEKQMVLESDCTETVSDEDSYGGSSECEGADSDNKDS